MFAHSPRGVAVAFAFTLTAGTVAGSLAGCMPPIEGSGVVRTETRLVSAFTSVQIESGLHADVTTGVAQKVNVVGDDNLTGYVQTQVKDGVLVVRLAPGTWLGGPDSLKVIVAAPSITALDGSGGSQLIANDAAGTLGLVTLSGGSQLSLTETKGAALTVNLSGGSSLDASGTAASMLLDASGGATVHARDLTTSDVVITGSGGSQLTLCASASVSASLSGGSRADVYCTPATHTSDLSGGSQLVIH